MSTAREQLLEAIEGLGDDDLRALAWIARALPFGKLLSDLRDEKAKGVRRLDPTTRAQVARAALLGALRDIAKVAGITFSAEERQTAAR